MKNIMTRTKREWRKERRWREKVEGEGGGRTTGARREGGDPTLAKDAAFDQVIGAKESVIVWWGIVGIILHSHNITTSRHLNIRNITRPSSSSRSRGQSRLGGASMAFQARRAAPIGP